MHAMRAIQIEVGMSMFLNSANWTEVGWIGMGKRPGMGLAMRRPKMTEVGMETG